MKALLDPSHRTERQLLPREVSTVSSSCQMEEYPKPSGGGGGAAKSRHNLQGLRKTNMRIGMV